MTHEQNRSDRCSNWADKQWFELLLEVKWGRDENVKGKEGKGRMKIKTTAVNSYSE